MASYDLGDGVPLDYLVYDRDNALADATVALTVTAPDGTTITPPPDVTHAATGTYQALVPADQTGLWVAVWTASGAVVDVETVTWTVEDPAPAVYTDAETVKKALIGKSGPQAIDVRGDLIDQAIAAAARMIDDRCGRRFYVDPVATARTFFARDRLLLLPDGSQSLRVDDYLFTADMTVETRAGYGGTWVPVTGWEAGPDNAGVGGRPWTEIVGPPGWLTDATKVRPTTRWGRPAPAGVSQANALLAARLYRRKDSPEGVLGSSEWGAVRVSRFDPDVETLIAPYILITA